MTRILLPLLSIAVLMVAASACGKKSDKNYDDATLLTYKRALPQMSQFGASAPGSPAPAFAVGDTAAYPRIAVPIAQAINGMISGTVTAVGAVADLPPTHYDSQTLEFVWGPFDAGDTALAGDTVTLYIRDVSADATKSFDYEFALLRGMGNDMSTLVPVIWGAATPDATVADQGVGVLLYDFVANKAFEDAHDPGHGVLDQGRFAALYSRKPDPNNTAAIVTIVLGSFRNFVPKDHPNDPATNDDYLWGDINDTAQSAKFDFLDFALQINSDPNTTLLEDLDLHLAFYNNGVGRAEALVQNGDLAAGEHVNVDECWDALINRTYYNAVVTSSSTVSTVATEGSASNCAFASLVDVPSIASVDSSVRMALSNIATNGVTGAQP